MLGNYRRIFTSGKIYPRICVEKGKLQLGNYSRRLSSTLVKLPVKQYIKKHTMLTKYFYVITVGELLSEIYGRIITI
jgi:hypothetical protein